MRILFLTSHWPLAPAYGAQQRVLNVGRLLGRLGELSFLILSPDPVDSETMRRTQHEFAVHAFIRPVPRAAGGWFERVRNRLRHEFDPAYISTEPVAVKKSDRYAIHDWIDKNDVVWIHGLKVANLLSMYRWPQSILDVDDLPSRVYRSAADSGRNRARRLLDLRMSYIWRRREGNLLERFDVLSVCSEDDRCYLGSPKQVHVVPNGFDAPLVEPHRLPARPPRVGFIGKLDWRPNIDSIGWFLREVWPLIKRSVPNAQFRLVGRGSDNAWAHSGPDVVGLGWLEDPSDEIATWSAMIVPIRVGGGTRIKVAEGFARKCPVVATSLGAFGYDVRSGKEMFLADSAKEFAAACIQLIRDSRLGQTVASNAYDRFLREWTWDAIGSRVTAAVEACLARSALSRNERTIGRD